MATDENRARSSSERLGDLEARTQALRNRGRLVEYRVRLRRALDDAWRAWRALAAFPQAATESELQAAARVVRGLQRRLIGVRSMLADDYPQTKPRSPTQ